MKAVPLTMRRSRAATWGLLAIAALLTTAFALPAFSAGLAPTTHLVRSAPVGLPTAARSGAAPLVHPAFTPWANITVTSTYASTVAPPIVLNYTIQNSSGVYASNLTVAITLAAGANGTIYATIPGPAVTGPNSITIGYPQIGSSGTLPTTIWNLTATLTFVPYGCLAAACTQTNASYVVIANVQVLNPIIAITSPTPVYSTFPLNTSFSLSVTGTAGVTADAANVTVGIDFELVEGTCAVIVVGCFVWNPIVVINQSLPFAPSGTYNWSFNATQLGTLQFNGGTLPTASYAVAPWAIVVSSTNPGVEPRLVGASAQTRFTNNAPTGTILSPTSATKGLTVGVNTTIAVSYSADYLSSATVNVTNTSSGKVVFTSGVFVPGDGGHGAAAAWTPGEAGLYNIVLTLSFLGPYQPPMTFTDANVSVAAASGSGPSGGGTTYVNTTNWHNASAIPGLTPAVGSAVLLVIGLIIGMIVALVLGRMMWAGRPVGPAQPWTASKTTTTTSTTTNECPVCHQNFATATELADHQKSAHGMS
jgi:hypothetical protein